MIDLIEQYQNLNDPSLKMFEKKLHQKMTILDRYFQRDSYPNLLKVQVKPIEHNHTLVSLQFYLRNETLMSEAKATSMIKALEESFNTLKQNTLKYVNQMRDHEKRGLKQASSLS